jgi:hypothetical protein
LLFGNFTKARPGVFYCDVRCFLRVWLRLCGVECPAHGFLKVFVMGIKKFAVAGCAVALFSVFSGVVMAGGKIKRVQVLPVEKEVQSYVASHFGREDVIEFGQEFFLVD